MRRMCKKLFFLFLTMLLVCSLGIVSSAASVKISKKKVTLYVTQTTTLKMTGTKKKVKWSTSNKKIAKVSSKGKVTAVKAGKATIKAKVGKKTYECKVTVKNGLNKTKVTLAPGKTTTLKLYGTSIKSVQTSKKSVATISKKGKITAKKAGTCKITITGKDKKKYTCTVTVVQKVKSLTLNKTNTSLKTGESEQLTVTAAPDNATNKKVTWSSSNSAVAAVDANGKVTAVKAGTAVITATAADGSGKTASCTVTIVQPATGVSLDRTAAELKTGASLTLRAAVAPSDATNAAVTWSSSNSAVAAVDANGKVTAVKAGTAVITVTTADGSAKTASCTVTVIQKATGIKVETAAMTIVEGKTATLKAVVTPTDTTNAAVTWSSSNPAVATVDANGVVTAVDPGKAEIKAVTADGTNLSASVAVTVEDDGIQEAANQNELNAALTMNNIHTVAIQTTQTVSLNIPAGTYTDKTLVVNAPNGEITNAAKWKGIELQAIAENTFIEKANGNSINYKAANGRLQIAGGASAKISVSGNVDNQRLNLENFGTIGELVLDSKAAINLTGRQTSAAIPVRSNTGAAGSSINTSQNLRLNAQSPISLILQPGAENTTATVNNDANRPQVSGLGSVTVTNTNTNEIDTIVADASSSVTAKTVTVTGVVDAAADNAPIAGVSVYLIPYNASINPEQIANYYQAAGVKKVQTASDGSYRFSAVELGNYYLAAAASEYAVHVQTLVITSVTGDTYNNTAISLVKANDNTPGNITGTLYDAFTGDPIDYPVMLKVRRGQNNISGTAVKTINVAAADYGCYSISNLTPGVYTLQALSAAGSTEKIMLTSFNVTVIPGETVTENYTLTKQLDDSQVRFVLTWGSEASGAPSDLDSHLVGPTASGNGRFHTWYSDQSYYANEMKYADLDVDDTTWEGPETTTIYVNTDGSYSFYVFDYSNQGDEYSTIMSNDSDAIVNVYKGETLIATFYVPTGQSGNLWHVCDYNANTGLVTGVNTIGYWPDGGSSSVGLSALEIARQRLNDMIDELSYRLEMLADCAYKNQLTAAIASAKSIVNSSDDETALKNEVAVLEEYSKVLDEMPYIVYVAGANVNRYDTYENILRVYGTEAEMGEISAEIEYDSDSEITYTTTYQAVSGKDYVGILTATRADIGLSRIWYVYYEFDPRVFDPTDVKGEGIVRFSCENGEYGRTLYVYGTTLTMPALTLTVNEKITYTFAEDPDGAHDAVIYMKYDNKQDYTYYVDYRLDRSVFALTDVSGEGITNYDIDQYDSYGELYLYGFADELPDFTVTVNDGVTWNIEEVDGDTRIVLTYGSHSYYYYVYYEFDSSLMDVYDITGDGIDGWDREGSTIYLRGTADVMPVFEVNVNEASSVSITKDDSNVNHAWITVTYGSNERTYEVYYIWNYRVFDIESISGPGVVTYDYYNDADGEDHRITLYGTGDTVDVSAITVSAQSEMIITVEAESDASTSVIGYVRMQKDDTHSIVYPVYYKKITVTMLTLNTEYSVNMSEEEPTKQFLFTPETDGMYRFSSTGSYDPYCKLYDMEGTLLKSVDDKDEDDYNFVLEYVLYAGTTYRFEVREYEDVNASFKVQLVLTESMNVVDPIEELQVAAELSVNLSSGEVTELDAAPEKETESETEAVVSETEADPNVVPESEAVTENLIAEDEVLLVDETEETAAEVTAESTEPVIQDELIMDTAELFVPDEVVDEELELIADEEIVEEIME